MNTNESEKIFIMVPAYNEEKSIVKTYKYKIIEYDYISMHYEGGEKKIEICKTLHKTNSWLYMMLIIICFKIN